MGSMDSMGSTPCLSSLCQNSRRSSIPSIWISTNVFLKDNKWISTRQFGLSSPGSSLPMTSKSESKDKRTYLIYLKSHPKKSSNHHLSSLFILCFSEGVGHIRVFSVKVALVTLCNGKLVDKLRCKSGNICSQSTITIKYNKFSKGSGLTIHFLCCRYFQFDFWCWEWWVGGEQISGLPGASLGSPWNGHGVSCIPLHARLGNDNTQWGKSLSLIIIYF